MYVCDVTGIFTVTNTNTVNIHTYISFFFSAHKQECQSKSTLIVSRREVYNSVYDCRDWKPIVATRRMPENAERNLDRDIKF